MKNWPTAGKHLERALLSCFTTFYGLALWPDVRGGTFTDLRLTALKAFLLIVVLFRGAVHFQTRQPFSLKLVRRHLLPCGFLLAFCLSVVMSTLLSPDPNLAWLGARHLKTGGGFLLLSAGLFLIYSTGPALSRTGLIGVMVFTSVLTIAEYLGFRPLNLLEDPFHNLLTAFPAATVGYRGQLAGLLLFFTALPLAWYHDQPWDWRFWSLFCLPAAALGCTSNTSAFLALNFSVLLFALLQFRARRSRVVVLTLATLICCGSYQILAPVNHAFETLNWVRQDATSKDLGNPVTLETRLLLWKAAGAMTLARPLVGWGPATFAPHVFAFLSPQDGDRLFRLEMTLAPTATLIRTGDSAVYTTPAGVKRTARLEYGSAHNAYLDVLEGQGVLGVGAAVGLALSGLAFLRRRVAHLVYVTLPFTAYGLYLMTWFLTVPVTPMVLMALGGVVAQAVAPSERRQDSR